MVQIKGKSRFQYSIFFVSVQYHLSAKQIQFKGWVFDLRMVNVIGAHYNLTPVPLKPVFDSIFAIHRFSRSNRLEATGMLKVSQGQPIHILEIEV